MNKVIKSTTNRNTSRSTNSAIGFVAPPGEVLYLNSIRHNGNEHMFHRLFAFAGAAALVAAASSEFWETKDPQDWNKEQVDEMLTRSPWAKPASISFNKGPGGADPLWGMIWLGIPGTVSTDSAPADPKGFRAVVRWQSALPVRAAARIKASDESARFYILAVVGDYPDITRKANGESEDAREQRQQMLREFTKLDHHGGPIYLDHAEATVGGTLFYFSRLDPIKPGEREVTFFTKMGPMEIKAKFSLKDMLYRGKLEL